jgi:hypothetical protein
MLPIKKLARAGSIPTISSSSIPHASNARTPSSSKVEMALVSPEGTVQRLAAEDDSSQRQHLAAPTLMDTAIVITSHSLGPLFRCILFPAIADDFCNSFTAKQFQCNPLRDAVPSDSIPHYSESNSRCRAGVHVARQPIFLSKCSACTICTGFC